MKILFVVFAVLITTKILLISCAKEKVPVVIDTFITAECPDTVFYKTKIEPIINQNCTTTSCHNASSNAGGYDLSSYSKVEAHASEILNSIDPSMNPVTPMPLGQPPLDSLIIQDFKCWINQGKLNN